MTVARPGRDQVFLWALTRRCHGYSRRTYFTDIPCAHALTVIYTCERAPADYFPDYIKAESWVATYAASNFPQINMDEVKQVHSEGRRHPERQKHTKADPKP
jgi:hypothetical protein